MVVGRVSTPTKGTTYVEDIVIPSCLIQSNVYQIVEHNGGWRGWHTTISRAPQDGLGVVVLTNWDQGEWVMKIIKYRLYEEALGLPHVDWSSR